MGGTLVYRLTAEELVRVRTDVANADLVHVHGLWNLPSTVACRLAARARTPYVVTPHGMLTRWSLARSQLKKRLYGALVERENLSRAAAIHFLNASEREESLGYGLAAPTFVLANGVDEGLLRMERSRTAMETLCPEVRGRTVVLFLGRLHHKKGLDRLLAAFADARGSVDDLHLLIAGPDEGGYQRRLQELVEELSLHPAVTFLGEVLGARKSAVLAGADLFALISREEGDSVAVKEAMAVGLPVIITDSCRLPEVGRSGAGRIVPPDVESVSRELVRFAGDPEARSETGSRGRALVRSHFASTEIGRRMLAEYARIMSSS
jgi:glycosyltransferase involved in cell wall biosynthesis